MFDNIDSRGPEVHDEWASGPSTPWQRARWIILLLIAVGGAIGLFLAFLLPSDDSSDTADEPATNGAEPAPAPAPVEGDDPAVEPADSTTTTTSTPSGVPDPMVGRWIQIRQIDVATGAAVDVVIGEALRLDIGSDGTFTQQLGNGETTDPQILRAIQDGDDLQVLIYADEERLADGEHRLAADVEIEDDTMAWTFGEESTLVFERN